MEVSFRFLRLIKSMKCDILARAGNVYLAFLQRVVALFSKEKLESNITPKIFLRCYYLLFNNCQQ